MTLPLFADWRSQPLGGADLKTWVVLTLANPLLVVADWIRTHAGEEPHNSLRDYPIQPLWRLSQNTDQPTNRPSDQPTIRLADQPTFLSLSTSSLPWTPIKAAS